jgi:hypothetical protein
MDPDFLIAWSRCDKALNQHALRITGNQHDADDLYAETFLNSNAKWPPSSGNASCGWFKLIMFQSFIGMKRSRRLEVVLDDEAQQRVFDELADEIDDYADLFSDSSVAEAAIQSQVRECLGKIREKGACGDGRFTKEHINLYTVYQLLPDALAAIYELSNGRMDITKPLSSVFQYVAERSETANPVGIGEALSILASNHTLDTDAASCLRAFLGLGDLIQALVDISGKTTRYVKDAVDFVDRAMKDCIADFIGDMPYDEDEIDNLELVRKADFDRSFDWCLELLFTDYWDRNLVPALRLMTLLCFGRYYSIANEHLKWTQTDVARHFGIAVGGANTRISQASEPFTIRFHERCHGDQVELLAAWTRKSHLSPAEKTKVFSHREKLILREAGIRIPRAGNPGANASH